MGHPRQIKWRKRWEKKGRRTSAARFLLACQPPTNLAINLQYKRSLISGSLIFKWIIIWLQQSSLLNVKCLQFVKWPLFQPWSEPHVQLLTPEWAPSVYIWYQRYFLCLFLTPLLSAFLFSSIVLYNRDYKDSLAQYGQRGEGTVPSINPGQGHGGPAGGAGWNHHRQHHPQRRQR